MEEADDAILKPVIFFREAVAPRWGLRVRKDLHGIDGDDASCIESIVRNRTCRDGIESRMVYMTPLTANKKDHATTSEKKPRRLFWMIGRTVASRGRLPYDCSDFGQKVDFLFLKFHCAVLKCYLQFMNVFESASQDLF